MRELARADGEAADRPWLFRLPHVHPSILTIIAIPLLCSCSRSPDLFPIEIGKSWKYVVTSGMSKTVATLKVTGRTPVDGVRGYELTSELGNFRVAWKDGWLIASDLAGTRFSPPMPILHADYKGVITWKGTVEAMGRAMSATAELTQAWGDKESRQDGKQGVLVKIRMAVGGKTIETESIYMPGIGLAEQSQRVDGLLTLRMKAL